MNKHMFSSSSLIKSTALASSVAFVLVAARPSTLHAQTIAQPKIAGQSAAQASAAEARAVEALAAATAAGQSIADTSRLMEEIRASVAASSAGSVDATLMALALQQRLSGIGQGTGVSVGSGRSLPAFYVGADSGSYDMGLSMLDSEQWQRAIEAFDRVIKTGKSRVDGAMYWKAYALDRLGQRSEALSTLQELQKTHPNSRWLDDAKALEIEVKSNAGQPVKPEDHTNDDLKLLAMNSLMHNDPDRAVPLLQDVLKGRNSLKVKERALFVLAQSDSPQAREALAQIARGGGNPDLQMKAVRYLGMFGRSNTQLLVDIYASSKDTDVKREVIRSLMTARDVDRLANIAKTEASAELRIEAVRQLGMLGSSGSARAFVLARALPRSSGRVVTVPEAGDASKAQADTKAITEALVQIYKTDKDRDVKQQVVDSLFMAQNAAALVGLARAETDPVLKKEIVTRLSTMKSKEATDYMLELLK